ncbi:MAG: ABC transporter ATP-binding protein [Vulcanimicrobiaceae bacterium]
MTLDVFRGEIFGVAGESGSGKTTLAEIIVGLNLPTSGSVVVGGKDVGTFSRRDLKSFRRKAQIVFQNPYDAHNPRFTVHRTVEEPLKIHGERTAVRHAAVDKALRQVGLEPPERYLDKFVHQLSGGERQRVSVARAITLAPELLLVDEPTSMLDVSVRAGVLNLLKKLNQTEHLTVIIISHDLCSLAQVTDRIAVMRHGMIVELGHTASIISTPVHSYTRALLAAVPDFDVDLGDNPPWIQRDLPSAADDGETISDGIDDRTELVQVSEGHFVRVQAS